jgi:hypothetical protein
MTGKASFSIQPARDFERLAHSNPTFLNGRLKFLWTSGLLGARTLLSAQTQFIIRARQYSSINIHRRNSAQNSYI